MEYAIILQILMELALSVSGEQELNSLLMKTSKAFHRKLDCTHVSIFRNTEGDLIQNYISPHWANSDERFISISRKLSAQCIFENIEYIGFEERKHYYYAFILKGYGTFCIARGQSIAKKLIKELEPILDMLATNILACHAFKRQKQVEKELRVQNDYIEYLAYHDTLTSLPNRRKYLEKLNEYLDENESGGVVLLDLDNFKSINDTLGHVFGDEVLKFIAMNLKKYDTESVSVFRFGGDEFLLLVKDKSKDEIESLVNDIFIEFDEKFKIANHEMDISFSIGITLFPEDSCDVSQLLMNADLALYSIKNSKKNGYRFFDLTLSKALLYKLTITRYLNEAIENDGFKLVYQPQVDVNTGYITAYEALLRFKYHSTSPTEFIPIAEENQSIIRIGRIVTSMAIKQIRNWIDQGYPVKPVSINFSSAQIYDVKYIDFIKEQLEHYKVDASLLEIEITESIFIKNKELTVKYLEQIQALGIKISIDDFGTGYSSLNYLTFLSLDKIKLDRSINIKFLELDSINVMESLISLSHSLDLIVVAEGIELEKQYHQLCNINCDIIQGYLFSKPLEVIDVAETFTKNYLEGIKIPVVKNIVSENLKNVSVSDGTHKNELIDSKKDSYVS